MKRKLLILVSVIIFVSVFIYAFWGFKKSVNADIVTKLEGQIYYTKRVDGILTLYKSNTNLENEKLIYSHKGKGKDNFGSYNDNVLDYCYDIKSGDISFVAMNNGEWSLFSLKEGENNAILINKQEKNIYLENTDYISNHQGEITDIQKEGSIYIVENGKERCIKKFYGLYDDKFTGYSPVGFSPDGKYLIYHSMGHLTFLGY